MAHHTSPGRGLLRSASVLASAVLSALACGDPPPVTPPPPLVTITVPEGNVVGTLVKLSVTVNGCDTVQSVQLFDHGEALRALPPNTGTTLVELQKNEIPYKRGISANLSLTAKAVCSDGRQSESQPVAATFFPVASVLEGGPGVQVVPDYFIADGSGSSVTFIGCGNLDTGIPMLYRVDANGEVKQQLQLPFVCNANTTITEKQPSTGLRWVWTADAGVIAINDAFQIVSSPVPQMRLVSLTVDPEGQALVLNTSGVFMRLKKDAGIGGNLKLWEYSPSVNASLIGTPIFRPELGYVLMPMFAPNAGDDQGAVTIHTLNYRTGPTSQGEPVSRPVVKYVYSDGTPPAASISADGQTMYLAFAAAGGRTIVVSCPTNGTLCELGNGQRWQSEAIQGRVVLMLPYAGTSRIAAIAHQHIWFMNPSTGAVLNKGGTAISPTGSLNVLQVQQGVGTREDFYLLNGSPGSLQSSEIVAVDRAENGEVFRYQVPGGDLTAAVDTSGQLWMRVNQKLVKALPLTDYRQALPR
jgi:hypothetical protein